MISNSTRPNKGAGQKVRRQTVAERSEEAVKNMKFVFIGEPNVEAVRLLCLDIMKWSAERDAKRQAEQERGGSV